MTVNIQPPFSNVQLELMKLFTAEIPDQHLEELKQVMARFLFEKARSKADTIWEIKGYDQKTIDHLLNGE